MNPITKCPACAEPVTISTLECPLCGEFIRTADEARILEQLTDVDALPLGDADQFFATFVSGADLRGADLGAALLSAANLAQADLTGANLVRTDLTEANLRGADLTDANLRGADLRGAVYDAQTVFPPDLDPQAAGAIFVNSPQV